MGVNTSSPIDRAQSRLAERVATGLQGRPTGGQEVSIARVVSDDMRARAWRVTLSRLERTDERAPLHRNDPGNSSPAFVSMLYTYAAGQEQTPAVPPRRSEPVLGFTGGDVEPEFVQIAFGQTTAKANRMIANWPAQGGSIVLVGSYVEVFGAYAVFDPAAGVQGEWPAFQAMITPADGLSLDDSGELSLQQVVGVPPFTAAVFGTLTTATDMHAGQVTPPPPVGALAGVLLDTAGSPAWAAVLTALVLTPVTFSISVIDEFPVTADKSTEVRDDQWWNPTTQLWQASPGNVGVVINVNDLNWTVAQLEAALGASALLAVTTPDVAHAAEVFLTAASGNAVSQIGSFAASIPGEEGGAVYVPDYARRVRVVLTVADPNYPGLNNFRVPLTGDPVCQLVWYDDRGNVVDGALQGTDISSGVDAEVAWHAVPARAVMLGIYSEAGTEEAPLQALVHWRIAP